MAGGKGRLIRRALDFLFKVSKRLHARGTGTGTLHLPSRPTPAGRFTPRPSWRDRHGFLTDGTYRVSKDANLRHTHGHAPPGKSHFNPGTDVDQVTLDAAQYADQAGLWTIDGGRKAKVPFDRDVGYHQSSDQQTNVVNVYRRKNGTIHGSPGSRL